MQEYNISEVKSANYCAILVDETKDVSRKEQLAILPSYISNGKVVERLIGCYHMQILNNENLSISICETIENCFSGFDVFVAQYYNGVFVVSGGVGDPMGFKQSLGRSFHAVFFALSPPYITRLHLVLTDCLRNVSELSEFFSAVQILTYLYHAAILEMNYL